MKLVFLYFTLLDNDHVTLNKIKIELNNELLKLESNNELK